MTVSCPFLTDSILFNQNRLTGSRALIENKYPFDDPKRALDTQWNMEVMELINKKQTPVPVFSDSDVRLHEIRMNILVFLGKREEALHLAE